MNRIATIRGFIIAVALFAAGCSARDPVTTTPYFHVGTPTNRSTVQSWELYREPYYTQPGVNHGDPVSPPAPLPSERGFEPYDPLAEKVYNALLATQIDTKYISISAKKDVVLLIGSAYNDAERQQIIQIASGVPGVRRVISQLTVSK